MENRVEDKKVGKEETELAKEANDPKESYIFQKNGITIKGFFIIVAILVLLVVALVVSGVAF